MNEMETYFKPVAKFFTVTDAFFSNGQSNAEWVAAALAGNCSA
jgi:hypothetical protein